MTTAPFTRPTLAPPAPCWFVRIPPKEDAVEVVFVGHANRAELEATIERLARWAWPLDEDGEVIVLADSHADPIGIRINHPADNGADTLIAVIDLLGGATVAGCDHTEWRKRHTFKKG